MLSLEPLKPKNSGVTLRDHQHPEGKTQILGGLSDFGVQMPLCMRLPSSTPSLLPRFLLSSLPPFPSLLPSLLHPSSLPFLLTSFLPPLLPSFLSSSSPPSFPLSPSFLRGNRRGCPDQEGEYFQRLLPDHPQSTSPSLKIITHWLISYESVYCFVCSFSYSISYL